MPDCTECGEPIHRVVAEDDPTKMVWLHVDPTFNAYHSAQLPDLGDDDLSHVDYVPPDAPPPVDFDEPAPAPAPRTRPEPI